MPANNSMPRLSMTQPMCEGCFLDFTRGVVKPTKLLQPELEVCCQCGEHTRDGIYVRIDPTTVAFATRHKS